MNDQNSVQAQLRHLKPNDTAAYLGISASKLAKLRLRANHAAGPANVKLAGYALYLRKDLDARIEAHLMNTVSSWRVKVCQPLKQT